MSTLEDVSEHPPREVTGDELREGEGKGQGVLDKAKDTVSDAADSIRGKDDE